MNIKRHLFESGRKVLKYMVLLLPEQIHVQDYRDGGLRYGPQKGSLVGEVWGIILQKFLKLMSLEMEFPAF